MKRIIRTYPRIFASVLAAVLITAAVLAADLKYTSLPQESDSELILAHKAATVPSSNTYTNIAAAGTTVVKTSSGILERVCINTGTASSTITLYDNSTSSGSKICTASTTAQGVLHIGARFGTGLTAVVSGNPDITIISR